MAESAADMFARAAAPQRSPMAARLLAIADRLHRLPPPDRRDPERFHIERDALARELRRLAVETDPARRSPARA